MRRSLLLAASSIAAVACGPDHGAAYEAAMGRADRAETRGQYAESAEGYDAASRLARVARDRAHAVYLSALMLERAGDLDGARARFEALAHASPPADDTAAAAYKEATMDIRSGDASVGWKELLAALLAFPDDGLGKPALHRIVKHIDETEGPVAVVAFLRDVEPKLDPTERAEEVAYEVAAHLEAAGELDRARDAYVRTAARWRYPVGALWDDALFRAAELDRRLGRPEAALTDLDAMLSQREVALLNGSATRPRFPEAQMLAATICRDDLHDAARARALFHAAFARFPEWGDRDRALFQEAELFRKDQRAAEECATLDALVRDMPDSRYVPCATARCSSIARPAGSRAPAACHAYIERGESLR